MKIQLMKPRAALAAALLLPIVILGVVWGTTYRTAQQGQEWLIPIQGYDPRDLLRGHYVQYRYDWPRDLPPDGRPVNDLSFADQLCIEGVAPHIQRVRPVTAVVGVFDQNEIRGCAIIARATLGARREVQGLNSGILFASQEGALSLSRQLVDPKMQAFVRVRIRPDGVIRPVELEFGRRNK